MKAVDKESVYSVSTDRETDEILLEPYFYILQVPGKMLRAKLVQAYDYWLNIPKDKLKKISEIVQMLHNASLLIDDIQDGSVVRRGIPVAHNIFGVATTLNAGNYASFITLEKTLSLNNLEAIKVYTNQMLELYRGQGKDVYWRIHMICPTEEEYKKMIIQKTGGLFAMVVQLMQIFSDNKSDFRKLTELITLYLQIRDDYCNLKSKEYFDSKTYCEDITEGKFGFPVIHALQNHPEDVEIKNILRQHTTDNDVKRYCVNLLEEYGSFEYTRSVLRGIDKDIRIEIEKLGKNPLMISVIDVLATSWGKDELED